MRSMPLARAGFVLRPLQVPAPQTFQPERFQRSPALVGNKPERQPALWTRWLREFVRAHARYACRRHLGAAPAQVGGVGFQNSPQLAPLQRLSAISVFLATRPE